jgi:16S rRNA (guanine966-N2)-methyltransferase
MRVIAGTYKGHRLSAPRRRTTRPTQDRVREALFNLLGPLDGERVLDLCAGSGALGIEALSRGAGIATFVDADEAAVRAARANLERLGIEHGGVRHQGNRVVRASVPAFLRATARAGERWDLVFCDPPYRLALRLARDLDELLPPVLADEARVVCESSHRQTLKLAMPLVTERRYGDTSIAVYAAALKCSPP